MSKWRAVALSMLLLPASAAAAADEPKGPKLSEKNFRDISSLLMSDPLNKSARDWSRLVMLYTLQTSDAVVILGRDELRWIDSDGKYGTVLLAAYLSGNIQSQLNSGVKRNDRYAGLLSLFRAYRALRENDKDFKIPQVDDLLSLQQEDRLLKHLQKFEDERPTRLGPIEIETIRKLMKTR